MWDKDLQALGEWFAAHSAVLPVPLEHIHCNWEKKRGKNKQIVVQSPALSVQLLQTPAAV